MAPGKRFKTGELAGYPCHSASHRENAIGATKRFNYVKTEIVKSFIQKVWNEGDVTAISQFVADHYTIIHDPGDPWDGKTLDVAGFKDRVLQLRAPVPDQCFNLREAYENESSVCVTWLWCGTHKGTIAGYAPTGKALHMSGATVYYFQNDKIAGHWQIADRLSVFQQLQAHQSH